MSTILQQPTALILTKQPSPLSIRVEQDLEDQLDRLATKLGKKRHAIASAALRLGAAIIEKNEEKFYEALVAAEKAKALAARNATEEEAEKAPKK